MTRHFDRKRLARRLKIWNGVANSEKLRTLIGSIYGDGRTTPKHIWHSLTCCCGPSVLPKRSQSLRLFGSRQFRILISSWLWRNAMTTFPRRNPPFEPTKPFCESSPTTLTHRRDATNSGEPSPSSAAEQALSPLRQVAREAS